MTDRAFVRSRLCVAHRVAMSCIAAIAATAPAAAAEARPAPATPSASAELAAAVQAAARAGDDARAIELMQQLASPVNYPEALQAAARAARNRGDYRRAATWFDLLFQARPAELAAAAGAAMSLAEAGDADAANARADRVLELAGDRPDLLLACAYVRLRSGRPLPALELYQRVLQQQPASTEAAGGARRALTELGAASAALEQGGSDAAEHQRLQTDRVAQAIRWADYAPQDRNDERAEARAALAAAEANLATLPPASAQYRRAQLDRLLALRQLERMDDIVTVVVALQREGVTLPSYVQVAYADALLYLRRPREAIAVYEAVLAQQPQQSEVELSLMYAQLEAENFAAARRTLDAAIAHNPAWTRRPGLAPALPNTVRARAEVSLALLVSFGDDLVQAQQRLEALLAEAPARTELQRELAVIYLRRGWPRRALEQWRVAQSLERETVALRLDRIAIERRLGRYDTVETALRRLESEVPANRHVQRERAEWDAFRGWQVDLGLRQGQGASSVFGNRERSREASVSSPLIGDFWRVYAQARRQDAEIPEGSVAYDRNGLGLRYDRGGVDLRLAAFEPNDGFSTRRAVEAALNWEPADRWWLAAQASSASVDTPLRARWYGITGRSLGVSAGFRRDERSELSLSLSQLDLSDGNRRDGAAFALREPLLTRPHFKLDLHGELAASRNTREQAPYFNPRSDRIALAGVRADWMTWRHYEYRFQQRLGLAAGSYWQQGFGSSGVLRADYAHEWQFGPGWSLNYGIGWYRQAYDGRRESRREWFAALHWGGMP